ncbi:hypothetical protein BASA81_002203 [Batrachochytrium salamandrivorans]|nr:hypothetical protein BASA81_002203 [Batrachochytrium salamandrivorans]
MPSEKEWLERVPQEVRDSVHSGCEQVVKALVGNFSILLVGSQKTGKTLLVESLLEAGISGKVVRITSPPKSMSQVRTLLDQIHHETAQVVFLDNVHDLLPTVKRTELEHKFEVLLIRSLKQFQQITGSLIVLTSLPSYDCAVFTSSLPRLKRVDLHNPTFSERLAQVSTATTAVRAEYIAQRTSGWTRGEINSFLCSLGEGELDTSLGQFRKQTRLFQETAVMQADALALTQPIGGLIQPRKLLHRFVIQHFATKQNSMRGVLLHGESGNGKTLLGLDLGRQVQSLGLANFFCVKCLDLISKVVGETESNVAKMFAHARESAPCLLFLDQLDALAPKRGEDGDSTSERTFDRVLSVLLVELDGILTKRQHSIVVLASCRAVECLEPALVRPGRLGTHILIPPANTVEEKVAVIQACTTGMPIDVKADFFTQFATNSMRTSETRAEIANLCREAAMCALRDDLQASSITEQHFVRALI